MTATAYYTRIRLYQRRVYKAVRPAYYDFIKSYNERNDVSTYRYAMKMIEAFEKLVEESKESLSFVEEYININILSTENKVTYSLLIDERRSELVKLDSYVVKTKQHFNNRQHQLPFIMNNKIPDLFLKAVDLLLNSYVECSSIRDGVKKEGVTYLVKLSSSIY